MSGGEEQGGWAAKGMYSSLGGATPPPRSRTPPPGFFLTPHIPQEISYPVTPHTFHRQVRRRQMLPACSGQAGPCEVDVKANAFQYAVLIQETSELR